MQVLKMKNKSQRVARSIASSVMNRQPRGIKRINRNQNNIIKEIYKYQHSNDYLFQRLPFARVVKQCIIDQQSNKYGGDDGTQYRLQLEALNALQTASEAFLVELFAMSQLCAEHANRVTIFNRDIVLVLRIKRMFAQ